MTDEARAARNAYAREYAKKNRKRINAYAREYAKNNPERVKAIKERFWLKKAKQLSETVSMEVQNGTTQF